MNTSKDTRTFECGSKQFLSTPLSKISLLLNFYEFYEKIMSVTIFEVKIQKFSVTLDRKTFCKFRKMLFHFALLNRLVKLTI